MNTEPEDEAPDTTETWFSKAAIVLYLAYLLVLLYMCAALTDAGLSTWFGIDPQKSWYIAAPIVCVLWTVAFWISSWTVALLLNLGRRDTK